MNTPKAFISHATEDKERFVLDFASKLRQNGVDAWLDKWEMYPGDSLVDKIFEEGIKDAKIFIVVLSENSIHKPWVREELNAGVVQRIERGCKLLPVVIDDCDVPVVLKHTVWQTIKDTANYKDELQQILLSIFGQQNKPPLEEPPSYLSGVTYSYPSLTKLDSLIFKYCCEFAIERQDMSSMSVEELFHTMKRHHIQRDPFSDSLSALCHHHYIKFNGSTQISISEFGLTNHINLYVNNYMEIYKDTAYNLANYDRTKNDGKLNLFGRHNALFVRHALDSLKVKGFVNFRYTIGGTPYINSISPMLKRHLQDIER